MDLVQLTSVQIQFLFLGLQESSNKTYVAKFHSLTVDTKIIASVCRNASQKAQVSLSLSESVLCLKEAGEENIPKDHRLDVSMVTRQTLGVFSHYTRM